MIDGKASFSLVLHAHIPYVLNHGVWPHGMDWLYEAAAETYIPLLNMISRLNKKKIPANLNISFSPILIEQLNSDLFKQGFMGYLAQREKLAFDDINYFNSLSENDSEKMLLPCAYQWLEYYQKLRIDFRDVYKSNIINAFAELQNQGVIEILVSSATHSYLPLLKRDEWVKFQIETAKDVYNRVFGKDPKGMWLPECGYRPGGEWRNFIDGSHLGYRKGIESFLEDSLFDYFIVDTHMLTGRKPIGSYMKIHSQEDVGEFDGIYKVNLVGKGVKPNSIAFFTRDPDTGIQVWSTDRGYPGDRNYLEFHKKRFPSGFRYWRVTGKKIDLGDKQVYVKDNTNQVIESHATHFVSMLENKVNSFGKDIVVVSPYDAELFGHWWFEGIEFLEKVFTILAENNNIVSQKLSKVLTQKQDKKTVQVNEGSWGDGGDHRVWYNENTKWLWEKIHWFEEIMVDFAKEQNVSESLHYLLDIMTKQMLILQSSDWEFLITTWSARDYSENRFTEHVNNFDFLFYAARKIRDGGTLSHEEWQKVDHIKHNDNCFGDIASYSSWRKIVRN